MEIFIADKYAKFIADHIDRDYGLAFLNNKLKTQSVFKGLHIWYFQRNKIATERNAAHRILFYTS